MKHRGRDFLLQHCPALHIELRGLTSFQAILRFIKEANSLQDGAVTFYRMRKVSHTKNGFVPLKCQFSHLLFDTQEKKEQKRSFLLGVALKGVCIYQVYPPYQLFLHPFLILHA